MKDFDSIKTHGTTVKITLGYYCCIVTENVRLSLSFIKTLHHERYLFVVDKVWRSLTGAAEDSDSADTLYRVEC